MPKLRQSVHLILSLAVIILVFLLSVFLETLNIHCSQGYRADKTLLINEEKIELENASTRDSRVKGLSGRTCMKDSQGMLFSFDKPGDYCFWMKEMNFPIDIVWLNESKEIIEIRENISPKTYPNNFCAANYSKFVIELNSNRAMSLGLKKGQILKF